MSRKQDLSKLPEKELFQLLKENFRLGAESCDRLARREGGPHYIMLIRHLKIVEDASRYVAAGPNGRGDSRWLDIAKSVAEAHKRAGDWLRRKDPSWRFKGLAEILRQGERAANSLFTKKTGRIGPILPDVLPAPHRENKPVSIILPDGYQRVHHSARRSVH